jgi:hypothetical protein
MFKDLNPQSFDGVLSFKWFSSEEGSSSEEALFNSGFIDDLLDVERAQVQAVILETLHRIGRRRFRRHFEIKEIMSFPDLHLFELKWQFTFRGSPNNLRLYLTLDREKSLVVGLCFREKSIFSHEAAVFQNQQFDIESASRLADKYWQNRTKPDGRASQ